MKFRLLLTLVCIATPMLINAQGGYLIKTNGEKVEIFSDLFSPGGAAVSNEYLLYTDKKGKEHRIHQSEVQDLYAANQHFTLLPITSRYNRLLKMLATNDKYFLTQYLSTKGWFLYVHDKKTREIVEGKVQYKLFNVPYDKEIMPFLRKYFSDCPDLLMTVKQTREYRETLKKRELVENMIEPFVYVNDVQCYGTDLK